MGSLSKSSAGGCCCPPPPAAAGLVHGLAAEPPRLIRCSRARGRVRSGPTWIGLGVALAPRPRRSPSSPVSPIPGGAVLVWGCVASRRHQFHRIAQVPRGRWGFRQDLTAALFVVFERGRAHRWHSSHLTRAGGAASRMARGSGGLGAFSLVLPALAAGHQHTAEGHDHLTTGDEGGGEPQPCRGAHRGCRGRGTDPQHGQI